MNRKIKVLLNFSSGLLKQVIVILCGFILPRYILLSYGSAITGLISSITHFLGFISLLDMGVGPVVQASLYKPLSQKNTTEISKILKASDVFFKRIALFFIIYIVILSVIYPCFINKEFDAFFTISILLIISVSTFAEYFFGITYKLLLTADQKSYVISALQLCTVVLNTIVSIILILNGFSIRVVKLGSAVLFVLRPLIQMLYVKKHYKIEKIDKKQKASLPQKWDSFAQHLATVVLENVDVVVLSITSNLINVAIYNVYYSVAFNVKNLIISSVTGLESLFGDMIAKNETLKLTKTFNLIEFVIHFVVMLIFTTAAILIVPFVRVYTRGISDANYTMPLFGFILVMAYAGQCLRLPYLRLVNGAGMFKETRIGALVAMFLNIIITVCAVKPFGLVGVATGTFIAMLFHTVYFVMFLRNHIINRSVLHFILHLVVDILVFCTSYFITKDFILEKLTYSSWICLGIKVFLCVFVCDTVLNFIVYYKQIFKFIDLKIHRRTLF